VLQETSPALREQRSLFLQAAKSGTPLESSHILRLLAQPSRDGAALAEEGAFLVGQTCGSGRAARLAEEASKQFGMPVVPWAAVAAALSMDGGKFGI
jgi:hypothetical protein